MAVALTIYEASLCSGCGQSLRYAMDDDLADEWTTTEGYQCGPCAALARAADRNKDKKHPATWRHVVGLREGWEKRWARKVAERSATAEG